MKKKNDVEENGVGPGWGGELGLKGVGMHSPQLTVRMQMVSVAKNAAIHGERLGAGGRESPTGWPGSMPGSRARTPLI